LVTCLTWPFLPLILTHSMLPVFPMDFPLESRI